MPFTLSSDPSINSQTCTIKNLGFEDYGLVWKLQQAMVDERGQEKIPDTLLVVEHNHVFTLGRKSPEYATVEAQGLREWQGIPLFVVERGGEATYHGPGQLVIYPIVKISQTLGARGFLRFLEKSLVELLAKYEIESYTREGATGVWLIDKNEQERKIASLGIAVRNSVSYHGLALNVSTNLDFFRKIKPCGFSPHIMTSMQEELGRTLDLNSIGQDLATLLCSKSREWR